MLRVYLKRCLYAMTPLIALALLSSASDSSHIKAERMEAAILPSATHGKELNRILLEKKATQFILGKTRKGRNIEAYYFPGSTDRKALVIGGMHGSELSSIEVAGELIRQLQNGDSTAYNVIVIPSLFPDNAEMAKKFPERIGDVKNIGRYSFPGAPDPNRQMPGPGQPYDEVSRTDHAGRPIEVENALMLELIQQYRPQRIVNLHAIRNPACAGVFADPRTDHQGIALGYDTDSSLAIEIAKAIDKKGGRVAGNKLNEKPTSLYYKDPTAVPAGYFQKRNFSGSPAPGHRGGGVSLGTWASTAVCDEHEPANSRDAMRILTIEFPGSKRPSDYNGRLRNYYQQQVEAYAGAIKTVFLAEFFVED